MARKVCLDNTPYGAHYYFMPFTRLSDPIKSRLFFSEALSTVSLSDSCQSYILAPSTGHMSNSSTPPTFVLQGDMGGERVLQKKWTTFLKAQLLCSLPDDGFPFNIIQDMFVLTPSPDDWKNTVFYGVFTSQWWGSAVIYSSLKWCSDAFRRVAE